MSNRDGQPADRKRRSLPEVFAIPTAVAALTAFGLLSALLGEEGVWLWMSWCALAIPIVLGVTLSFRRNPNVRG